VHTMKGQGGLEL